MANEQGLKVLLQAELNDFLKDMKSAKDAIVGAASSTAQAVQSFLGLSSAATEASRSTEDLTGALKDESKAATGAAGAAGSLGDAVAKASGKFVLFNKAMMGNSNEMKAFISLAKLGEVSYANYGTSAGKAAQSTQEIGKAASKTGAIMSGLNNVVRDAPYGFTAVANNITQVADAIFGASAAAAAITFGISLAVTAITSLIQKYGSLSNAVAELTGGLSQQQKAQQAISEALKGAEGEYTRAVANVTELRNEIALAKDGFLDKDKVVKHYNETIGKTVGTVKSLEEAELSLQKNADAYIRFTLLKAAANEALQAAAKKAFAAEIERRKTDEESTDYILSGLKNSKDTSVQNIYKNAAARNREVAAAEAEKDRKTLEDIAKSFEDQAAALAKSFNFDFFGGSQDNTKSNTKTVASVLKELGQELTKIDAQFAATGGSLDDLSKNKIAAFKKAIGELSELGVLPGSKIFDNLQQQVEGLQNTLQRTPVNLKIPVNIDPLPKAVSNLSPEAFKNMVDSFKPPLDQLTQELNKIIETSIENGVVDIASAFGNALITGDFSNIAKSFANGIGGFMQEIGRALVATGIGLEAFKNSLKSLNGPLAIVAGVGLIAAGAAFKAIASKGLPSFATGGVVNGPTLAMVGDNPSGVEYMIPKEVLDKLGGSSTGGGVLTARVSGTDLLFILETAEQENGRFK